MLLDAASALYAAVMPATHALYVRSVMSTM